MFVPQIKMPRQLQALLFLVFKYSAVCINYDLPVIMIKKEIFLIDGSILKLVSDLDTGVGSVTRKT